MLKKKELMLQKKLEPRRNNVAKKEYIEVGSIRKGDYGLYIKLHPCRNKGDDGVWKESSVGLKKLAAALNGADNGLNLSIEKPADEIDRMCANGFFDESEAEKRKANVPEWKKYTIKLVLDNN